MDGKIVGYNVIVREFEKGLGELSIECKDKEGAARVASYLSRLMRKPLDYHVRIQTIVETIVVSNESEESILKDLPQDE